LQVAIEQGLTVLGWYENLPKDDVPAEHLWEDAEGLDLWWKAVEARRNDGFPPPDRGSDSSDDPGADPKPGTAENDLARYLKAKG
jgi:hypothetical protein